VTEQTCEALRSAKNFCQNGIGLNSREALNIIEIAEQAEIRLERLTKRLEEIEADAGIATAHVEEIGHFQALWEQGRLQVVQELLKKLKS
jgi:hypothetical protein